MMPKNKKKKIKQITHQIKLELREDLQAVTLECSCGFRGENRMCALATLGQTIATQAARMEWLEHIAGEQASSLRALTGSRGRQAKNFVVIYTPMMNPRT
jgi:hypothetical protein